MKEIKAKIKEGWKVKHRVAVKTLTSGCILSVSLLFWREWVELIQNDIG